MVMKKYILFYFLSILCFIVSGISLLCVPLTNVNSDGISKSMMYIIAAVFWLGIICEVVLFLKANSLRRAIEQRNKRNNVEISSNTGFGFISFFRNREAIICDILLFVSVILFAVLTIFKIDIQWLIIISVVLLFLSFNMHCFINGKNYKYIKSYKNHIDSEEHQEHE